MMLAQGSLSLPASSAFRRTTFFIFVIFAMISIASPAIAQQYDPSLYSGMQWRQIGPFRAGRVTA